MIPVNQAIVNRIYAVITPLPLALNVPVILVQRTVNAYKPNAKTMFVALVNPPLLNVMEIYARKIKNVAVSYV